jgi:hypothetical protein
LSAASEGTATVINCIGIGFQRGTHTRWQLVANDGTGAPTLTDMGASFAIATGGVLTLYIAAPPNGGSVWVRVVDEIRVIHFAPLPEVQFAQQPTLDQNRQGAVNCGPAHRPFNPPRHIKQLIGRVMAVRAESRLNDGVTLRGLAQAFAGKELADLIAHDLFHG